MPDDINKLPYYISNEDKIFSTMEEFVKFTEDQNRVETVIDNGANVKFAQDEIGKLTIDFGKGPFKFHETGFIGLCKTLKVPSRYLQSLPSENLIKDLFVGMAKCNADKLNLVTKADRFTGIAAREERVSTREILNRISNLDGNIQFKELSYLNEQTRMSIATSTIVPLPNEVFDCGVALFHDDSSGLHPDLNHYIYRQTCSNGAKTTKLIKISGFSQRMSKLKMLDLLPKKIQTNVTNLEAQITSTLTSMSSMLVGAEDKKYIKKFLAKKLGFNVHKDGFEAFDKEMLKETATYYDLMNFITNFAKKFDDSSRKDSIEHIGGDMLGFFKQNHRAMEPLQGFNTFKTKQLHKELTEA